jgi:hypothetical protein
VTRNTDRPGKFASCEPLPERRAHPIARIRQHTAKAHTGGDDTINLSSARLPLVGGGRGREAALRPSLGQGTLAACHTTETFRRRSGRCVISRRRSPGADEKSILVS